MSLMKMYTSKELVSEIKREQLRLNVSRAEILKRLGVSAPTFSRWKYGETMPAMNVYIRVTKKLRLH